MIKKITIVSDKKRDIGYQYLLGENVDIKFERDFKNRKDENAVKVICNNQPAGYVANNEVTILKETTSATIFKNSLNDETKIKVKTIKNRTNSDYKWNTYFCEVELSLKKEKKEEEKQEVNVVIEGTVAIYPHKTDVLKKNKQNEEVSLSVKETDRGLEVFELNDSIGTIKTNSQDYETIKVQIGNGVLYGKLDPKSTMKSVKAIVKLGADNSAFDSEIERLIIDGILTSKEIEERINYMRKDIKLADETIKTVLENIELVSDGDKSRLIKTPKTKYVDYNGDLKDSITYINKKKFLRFVGGKASGKNTAADTISWLYNKPKGEVAVNEGLDKVDLVGSRIIDSDENGNMIMPFELSTFVEGLKKGWCLVLDEINTASSSLLTILHGLDSRRCLDVPGYGTVKVHPNSIVILTMNEDYVGTTLLNEATVDRFTPIIFEDSDNIKGILSAAVPTANDNDISICQRFYGFLKNLHKDGKITSYAISVRGFIDALDVASELGLKSGIKRNVVDKGIDADERMVLKNQLSTLFD